MYVAECRPTWIIRNNTHSAGATLIVEPISAEDCLNRCAVSSTCVAVDLLTSCTPPQCWMHHRRSDLQHQYHAANVTQYEVATRCATIAPPVSGNEYVFWCRAGFWHHSTQIHCIFIPSYLQLSLQCCIAITFCHDDHVASVIFSPF